MCQFRKRLMEITQNKNGSTTQPSSPAPSTNRNVDPRFVQLMNRSLFGRVGMRVLGMDTRNSLLLNPTVRNNAGVNAPIGGRI